MQRWFRLSLTVLLCTLFVACGTGSSSGDKNEVLDDPVLDDSSLPPTVVSTTQSGGLSNDSRISLRLTDAPIDNLVRAVIEFTAVELKLQAGGWVKFTLATPKSIDMLKLQGGNTADLLINVAAPSGDYKEIRLITSNASGANFVEETGGGILPLQIPGGQGSGLMLKQNFAIRDSQASSFIIDFDLRQSIRSPGNSGRYQFKEVMRLVEASNVGGLRGMVDPMMLTRSPPDCSDTLVDTFNAAYLFAGHDVIPSDINQISPDVEPVTTAAINYDPSSNEYVYEIAFLPAGDYTVAVTCKADQEDLEANDDLRFFDTKNVTIITNNIVFLRAGS